MYLRNSCRIYSAVCVSWEMHLVNIDAHPYPSILLLTPKNSYFLHWTSIFLLMH